jgi:hypothetical protein
MDIWYNDSAGTTHQMVADILVSQSDDYYRLAAPGVNPTVHNVIHYQPRLQTSRTTITATETKKVRLENRDVRKAPWILLCN